MPPKFENAPGLTLKPRRDGYEARWQARTDLVQRGYPKKSVSICLVTDNPTDEDRAFVSQRCRILQDEMLIWGRGGGTRVSIYDGTIKSLAGCYQTDPDSSFHQLRYKSRQHYAQLLTGIIRSCGEDRISDFNARRTLRLYESWLGADKHVAMAHALIGMLRTITTFGATILECQDCRLLKVTLHDMRFKMPKPRNERLTADQADAIRKRAHQMRLPSIALAQALQFDCMLRQKDVIGEWVPIAEPGTSDVTRGNLKWMMGLRWSEIDQNLILRHVTSKRGKLIEIPLKEAPMVMEEFAKIGTIPTSGPVVVYEDTQRPYDNHNFRRLWREIANDCDIPRTVKNMDSRAGAISEATDAGADLEHVRQAATHGDIAMTQRYSRNAAEKTANVMRQRAEYRKSRG